MGDHDELRAVGVAAQQRQEAVEVEVVERGLDLVEDVERARAREEHGEQERERGHRLLAAGEQRQALGRLAGGGDLDLDARKLRSSSPRRPRRSLSASAAASIASASRSSPCGQRLAAEHRPRRLLFIDEPQASAAAREDVADELLEVACGRRERLLEGLLDLAVGLADHPAQLAQRRLQVAALALELLDVRERLGVLLLGERVDRAELLAPAGQPLARAPAARRLLLAERLRRLRALRSCSPPCASASAQAEPLAHALQLELRLAGLIAQRAAPRPRPR